MFWDSSAMVPCVVSEAWSAEATSLLCADHSPVIWWAAPVECVSALERKRREGGLRPDLYEAARRRLEDLCERVDVVEAHPLVLQRAIRLLTQHPLRAADALQLAAALVHCEDRADGETFVCMDERLRQAADQEGFTIVPEHMR